MGGGGNSYEGRQQAGYGQSTGTPYGDGGAYGGSNNNFSEAAQHASQHYGQEDSSLFHNAVNQLHSSSSQGHDFNEQEAMQSHQQLYGGQGGSGQSASSGTMGRYVSIHNIIWFLDYSDNPFIVPRPCRR